MPVFASNLDLAALAAAQGILVQGAPAGAGAGVVAAVGDFNGDGFGDFIIGAPFFDPAGRQDAGGAYLVLGSATPPAAINLGAFTGLRIEGAAAGDLAGWSVAGVGDLNGDGRADLVIGAPLADTGGGRAGATYVVFGSTSATGTLSLGALNGANGFRLKGGAGNDGQGYSVAAAGDVNNDGLADLVVSAPQADPQGRDTAGEVYVVYGRAGGFGAELDLSSLNGGNGFRIQGAADGDLLGEAVASAGDIDGDGFDDLVIGAADASAGGRFEAGRTYVVYGAASIASVVDLAAPTGRVTRIDGLAAGDHLGDAVSAAGDVNGDGLQDFLVGAPGADAHGRLDSGSAFLIYGRAGGLGASLGLSNLDAVTGVRVDGAAAGDFTGASLAAGDINGDGLTDILVGAPGADVAGRVDNGAVYALLTNVAGFPAAFDLLGLNASYGSVLWGAAAGDVAGASLAGVGDSNGDGYDDFLIGAQFGGTGDGGAAYLIYGGPTSGGGAVLLGDAGANTLTGGPDNEIFRGQGGNDRLIGGAGADVAAYQARAADYAWWRVSDGSWRVQDLRPGSPEGLDTLTEIEQLQFADRNIKIIGASPLEQVGYAFENVMRRPASGADLTFVAGLASQIVAGAKTFDQAAADVVARADPSTAVAAMSYQFFLGYAPSKGGFDFLVSPSGPNPNNLNSAYYQFFNYENRFINFAVNLGKFGEGATTFGADYGGLTLSAATTLAYTEIFGLAPSAARVSAILGATFQIGGQTITRADYFAIYGGDGLTGIGTKAAMVGFLLAVAANDDLGVLARSSNAYLADLADGAPFQIDIVGTYAQPGWAFGDG